MQTIVKPRSLTLGVIDACLPDLDNAQAQVDTCPNHCLFAYGVS